MPGKRRGRANARIIHPAYRFRSWPLALALTPAPVSSPIPSPPLESLRHLARMNCSESLSYALPTLPNISIFSSVTLRTASTIDGIKSVIPLELV